MCVWVTVCVCMCVSPEVVPALRSVASVDGSGLTMLRHLRGRLGGKYDLHCQRKEGRLLCFHSIQWGTLNNLPPNQLHGIYGFVSKALYLCKMHVWLCVYVISEMTFMLVNGSVKIKHSRSRKTRGNWILIVIPLYICTTVTFGFVFVFQFCNFHVIAENNTILGSYQ